MPRRKLTEEEKTEINKKKVYDKILNNEQLTITDLSKLLDKKSCTIKRWEWDGMIPKPAIINGKRHYTIEDFGKVLHGLYEYPWQRKVINKEEIKKLMDYVDSMVAVNPARKRDINANPYEWKGDF